MFHDLPSNVRIGTVSFDLYNKSGKNGRITINIAKENGKIRYSMSSVGWVPSEDDEMEDIAKFAEELTEDITDDFGDKFIPR